MDPANPSARYLTLRHILRQPKAVLEAERLRILSWTPIREVIQHWNRVNFWGRATNPYYGGPVGNFGTLSLLAQVGAPHFEEIEPVCESMLAHGRRSDGRFAPEEEMEAPWLCYTGMALQALYHFGYGEDLRFQSAWQALVHTLLQRPGMLACPIAGGLCQSGMVKALGALLLFLPSERSAEDDDAIAMLSEQLLNYTYDFGGKMADWLQPAFPRYYESDIVELCHVLARSPNVHPHRFKEILQRMINLQTEEGRWRKTHVTPMLSAERIYQPSRWVTFEAIHTLILFYGDSIYAS